MRKPPTEIEYNGKVYHLVPWFDQVLDWLEISDDLTPTEYAVLFLDFFVKEPVPFDTELFVRVNRAIFGETKGDGENYVDFKQDEGRIYAAFMQAYHIDLYEQFGKMHWQTFITLLGNIPNNTAFSEVVNIRARKIPEATKYNQEEIRELLRLKAKYRVHESEEKKKQRLNQQWAGIFKFLTKGSENNG